MHIVSKRIGCYYWFDICNERDCDFSAVAVCLDAAVGVVFSFAVLSLSSQIVDLLYECIREKGKCKHTVRFSIICTSLVWSFYCCTFCCVQMKALVASKNRWLEWNDRRCRDFLLSVRCIDQQTSGCGAGLFKFEIRTNRPFISRIDYWSSCYGCFVFAIIYPLPVN